MQTPAARRVPRPRLRPLHVRPRDVLGERHRNVTFRHEAAEWDRRAEGGADSEMRWWDYWLKGVDNGINGADGLAFDERGRLWVAAPPVIGANEVVEQFPIGQRTSVLFSDRGLYRPGDTVNLGMIVRAADWVGGLVTQGLERRSNA